MTQEDKDLLLRDLCARLLDAVIIQHPDIFRPSIMVTEKLTGIDKGKINDDDLDISFVKPYLRPMSSMTEEEKKEYYGWVLDKNIESLNRNFRCDIIPPTMIKIDWLNAHHFDYRGLIDKGLALEVTDENNPYK